MTMLPDPQTCKHCGNKGKVIDSRPRDGFWWRRRQCRTCTVTEDGTTRPHRWNSYETLADPRKEASTKPLPPQDVV